MRLNKPGSSIEGNEILLTGLKIEPSIKPCIQSDIDDMVFPISIKRRSDSTITKEYSPKKHKIKASSLLDLNSKLEGKNIWGFSNNPMTKDNIIVGKEGSSSSHSGQHLKIFGICYMELVESWDGTASSKHPKDQLLS
ncbi:MAG: hypothetical protein GF353_00140 [Candidatus Lokiarchaeota archaeon]|nr:hypothetical protein [Candidatus Lokiarchaeota archaeon]